MFCKKCGKELSRYSYCQNCIEKESAKNSKKTKKVFKIILYIVLVLVFLASWPIRKEFIVGGIPNLIHLGAFYLLFLLI